MRIETLLGLTGDVSPSKKMRVVEHRAGYNWLEFRTSDLLHVKKNND